HLLLRPARDITRRPHPDLGPFAGRLQELVQVVHQELGFPPGAIFEDELESAGRADTLNGGWREGEYGPLRKSDELQVQLRLDHLELLLDVLPVFPRLQGDPEERVVSAAGQAEGTEPDSRGRVLDPRRLLEDFFH